MAEIVRFEPDNAAPSIVGFESDEPSFGSGTMQRMAEYKGLSPEQAAGKARGALAQDILGAGKSALGLLNPVQLGREMGQVPGAVSNLAQSVSNIPKYYYENPDVLATDVASMAMPLGPVKAGAKVAEAAPEVAAALTPIERAGKIKASAGAGIQAAKESGVTVPASEAKQLLDSIKSDTASEYNRFRHTVAKGFLRRFEDTVRPKKVPGEAAPDTLKGIPIAQLPPGVRARIEAKIGKVGPEPQITVKNLHDLRQDLNDVYKSPHPQERQVAYKAKAKIDEFIGNRMAQGQWSNDMRDYALASTAEEMRNLVERAEYRRSQLRQGRLDAALATEFRNWARPTAKGPNANMRMLRALSPESAAKVEAFAKGGGPIQDILRGLGTMAPTNVMNFSLDHIAGHLLHAVLPGGPYTLMGIGALSKYLAGDRAMRSIDDIIKTLNEASDGKGKLAQYEQSVSPKVASHVALSESGRRALRGWLKGGSARVLAITIARSVNNPQLAPRIQQELENMDQDNNGRSNSLTPAVAPAR